MRKFILKILILLRDNKFTNKLILNLLIRLHNSSYHWIGFFSSLNGIHPKHKVINYHKFFIDNILQGEKVLDIGCGNGMLTYDIAEKADEVTGIDISKKNIETAKKKFNRDNLHFIIEDATCLKLENNFDVIVLSNVLEHIKKRNEFLSRIKNLAPKILIRVPLLTRDWLSVYKKENGFEYRLDNTHFIEYTEESFKEEIEKAGMKLINYYVKFGELYAIIKTKE